MNAKTPDLQNQTDLRNLYINKVGIKSLKYPLSVEIDNKPQATIATLNLYTELPANKKGANMSRFIEVIEEFKLPINHQNLIKLNQNIATRCEAHKSIVHLQCTIFLDKIAPVSKITSKLDYELKIESVLDNGEFSYTVNIQIPVKSLCPCSKAISQYGAHNQRSHIVVSVTSKNEINITEIIKLVEAQASCEIYSLLKRGDEKYVTEHAYENPKFVEDSVRDVVIALKQNGYANYTVTVENFESIHNHSAYALISS